MMNGVQADMLRIYDRCHNMIGLSWIKRALQGIKRSATWVKGTPHISKPLLINGAHSYIQLQIKKLWV